MTYSVNIDRQTGPCVQRHCLCLHCVFIMDVLEESHTAQSLLDYYCTRNELSECFEGVVGVTGGRGDMGSWL